MPQIRAKLRESRRFYRLAQWILVESLCFRDILDSTPCYKSDTFCDTTFTSSLRTSTGSEAIQNLDSKNPDLQVWASVAPVCYDLQGKSRNDYLNMDCHEFDKSNSRNDTTPRHCEGAERLKQSKILESTQRDISGLRPQYDKATSPLDSHNALSPNYTITTLKESFLKTGRLDAEYYQSKYEKNEALLKSLPHKRLCELVDIYKSIEPGSDFYKENGLPFVRVSNLSKFGVGKSEVYLDSKDFTKESLENLYPRKDDVLLSKDGSVGIAYAVEYDLECVLSGAILRLKIKDKAEIQPKYLSLVLNAITTQLQAQRDCGGSIIAHWRLEEIQSLLIPLLDSKTQEKIESKIAQSFNLREKSKELLDKAKQRVEKAIEER